MIRRALFWMLFPLVLPQAMGVRKHAPKVSAAEGPTKGSVGDGRRLNLVAVGDSIIAGVGASRLSKALVGRTAEHLSEILDCSVNWSAIGKIGARSDGILTRLIPKLPDQSVDVFVLSVGVNDITGLVRTSRWASGLNAILDALGRHSPGAVIAVAGIPPLKRFPLLPQPLRTVFGIRAQSFDFVCRQVVARHPMAVHVPLDFDPAPEQFSPDGYHPSEASYRIFGRLTAERIAERAGTECPHP